MLHLEVMNGSGYRGPGMWQRVKQGEVSVWSGGDFIPARTRDMREGLTRLKAVTEGGVKVCVGAEIGQGQGT